MLEKAPINAFMFAVYSYDHSSYSLLMDEHIIYHLDRSVRMYDDRYEHSTTLDGEKGLQFEGTTRL